jgi:hypothetical protein
MFAFVKFFEKNVCDLEPVRGPEVVELTATRERSRTIRHTIAWVLLTRQNDPGQIFGWGFVKRQKYRRREILEKTLVEPDV